MQKKHFIIIATASLIAAILFYVFYYGKDKKDDAIRTTGIIEGVEVNLAPKVSGRISKICCNEGDMVRDGQPVIKLESDDLTAAVRQAAAGVERAKADIKVSEAAIESARAHVNNAGAEIKKADAEIENARARMEETKRRLERLSALYKDGLISLESYDAAKTNYDASVATYNSSKAGLEAAYSGRDAATAELNTYISQLASVKARLKEAEANFSVQRARLSDTTIVTPISGVVTFKALEKGETVSPGVTIMTIVDMDNLYVRADIEETLIGNVAINSPVTVRAEGVPDKEFKGIVSEIGRYADFATQRDVQRGRQDIKTFRVRIRLDDTGGLLKPGMTVDVEIPRK
ncbi:MAG: HlyD family secretion protein [Nitrospirae bacterium]|nr:HlyD family secretion protein [Nitrospirota bacterium]